MNVQDFDSQPGQSAGQLHVSVEQGIPASQSVQSATQGGQGTAAPAWADAYPPVDPQQPFREYASPRAWTPPAYPTGAYQPANPAYPAQPIAPPPPYAGYTPYTHPGYGAPAYPGYAAPPYAHPGYGYPTYGYPPGYGAHPWVAVAPRPKRDRYLLVVGITAFICSCLTVLGGLASLGIMLLVIVMPGQQMTPDQFFNGIILFLALTLAGLVGGGFCTYHSVRSLFLKKPSRNVWLPYFGIFLLGYLATLGLAYWLNAQGSDAISPQFKGVLIFLCALLPALAILALGIRRLRFSAREQWSALRRFVSRKPGGLSSQAARSGAWPTSWRRLVLALVSGATLSITLALVLEYLLQIMVAGSQNASLTNSLSNPNVNLDPSLYGVMLILLAVIAPIVEELVKPLAVVILIGRVRSKAEAFALGLASGIGFNLVETVGYISSSSDNWLHIALIRSGAGLLHGFGAAMVALGWYILTHKSEGRWSRRLLLAVGCVLYAMLQHALWNGSWGLTLIPGPVGDFFQNWSWTFNELTIDGPALVNIIEMVWMVIFFTFMTGFLRVRTSTARSNRVEKNVQPSEGTYIASV